LEKQLRVESPDGPELPRVTICGDDPALPKVLVEAVVTAYLEGVRHDHQEDRQMRIDQLRGILTTYEARLQRLQATKNELVKAMGATSDRTIVLKQELVHKQLAQAQTELVSVNADLRRWELQEKVLQPQGGTPDERLIDAAVEKELEKEKAARKELIDRLEKAKQALDDPEHPALVKYRRELEEKTKFIDEQRKTLRESVKADLPTKNQADAKVRLRLLKERIVFSKQLAKLLTDEVGRLQGEAKDFTNKAIYLDLDAGRIDLQQAEAGVSLVKNELDKAIVELPASERVKRYDDEAIVVAPDDAPRKLRSAGLAGLGAFGAVLLLSFLEFPGRGRRATRPGLPGGETAPGGSR